VHVADIRAARRLALFDSRAERLARAFWPGPLTLVLRRRAGAPLSRLLSTATQTVALRVPEHPVALAIIRAAGRPVAAPSANRSGAVSPTQAAHVRQSLGQRELLVIDGGPTRVGIESTVLDLSEQTARLLRPGGVPVEILTDVIGNVMAAKKKAGQHLRAPGQLASHYAPTLPVRMNARSARPGEAYLAFGKVPAGIAGAVALNLSPRGDLNEAAANLFAMIRSLDRPEFRAIAVAAIPERGLGRAINDRLRRAAAPRRSSPKGLKC
jgi:L-threonylcarbamoyladenylate synthase